MALISTSQKMSDFGAKAEQFLTTNYPGQLDKAVRKIHIGSNLDTAAGLDAGYRITGATRNAAPDYMETPDKVLGDNLIANAEAKARTVGFETKITDSAKNWIAEAIQRRVDKGEMFDEAKKKVYDSIDLIGYKDKDGKMVAQPVIKGVNDSDLVNMQVPFWNYCAITTV